MHTVNNDKNGSELWPKIFCYRFHKTFWCSQAGNIPGCDGNQFRIRLPWVSWRTVSQVNVLFAVWPECHPKAFKSRLREDVRKGDTARYVWKKIWHRGQKVVVFLQGELILHLALLWSVSCHKKDHKDWKQEDKEDSVYIRARIPQVLCELTFQNVERESVSRAWSFSALHLMGETMQASLGSVLYFNTPRWFQKLSCIQYVDWGDGAFEGKGQIGQISDSSGRDSVLLIIRGKCRNPLKSYHAGLLWR